MIITRQDVDEFEHMFNDILSNDEFLSMKKYIHHNNSNCYQHSYKVWLITYVYWKYHKKLNLYSMTKAALLHDFFLYDWREILGTHLHGFYHPKIASKNAQRIFNVSLLESNIISEHMYPLTFYKIPTSKESWIVSIIDKIVSIKELLNIKNGKDTNNELLL